MNALIVFIIYNICLSLTPTIDGFLIPHTGFDISAFKDP